MTEKFRRVAPPQDGDLDRRIADLEREVRSLRASRRLEAATIGKGGLTVQEPGDIKIVDGDGTVLFSAHDGPIRTTSAANEINSMTFTIGGTWNTAVTADVPLAQGFGTMMLSIVASVGVTVSGGTGAGWIGGRCNAWFIDAAGNTISWSGANYGTAPTSFIPYTAPGGPASTVSAANLVFVGPPPNATAVRVSAEYALALNSGGSQTAGSANAHVFGSIIHTR